jgi:hypothetical protein
MNKGNWAELHGRANKLLCSLAQKFTYEQRFNEDKDMITLKGGEGLAYSRKDPYLFKD